jgi:hypothetical protein
MKDDAGHLKPLDHTHERGRHQAANPDARATIIAAV